MGTLKLHCKPLDDLLGDGLEAGIVTKIYGEAGSGKTNICLQASRECIFQKGKVGYIDSEGVSLKRLEQLCGEQKDQQSILKNILFFSSYTFEEQEKTISKLSKRQDIQLIIVDTLNMLYRVALEHDPEKAMRSYLRQMTTLQITARQQNRFVIVVEQVYTDQTGVIKPFTNRDSEQLAKTIVKLEKSGRGERRATLMKHRFKPEGKTALFNIQACGLE